MKSRTKLDQRVAELGEIVREIMQRLEGCNATVTNGPHVDLTLQETRVVEFLEHAGNQMMRSVATHLGIAVNSVTTLVDSLENKGLLSRVRSDQDRRVIYLELTDSGSAAAQSIRNAKNHFHREMLSALTDEEQSILLVLLRKIGGLGDVQPDETSAPQKAVAKRKVVATRKVVAKVATRKRSSSKAKQKP